jgi:hypothetical protein
MEEIRWSVRPVVSELTSVERLRAERGEDEPRLVGPVLGILNLFFLAYFERYLTGERSAETLALLLFLEISLFVTLAVARYLSVTEETLRGASIFPIAPWDRFVFTGLSNLRRPVVLLWWGSVVLAFLILDHGSVAEVILPALLFSLLVLCAQMVVSMLLLASRKREGSGGAMVWGLLALVFCTAVASLLFAERSLLHVVPPVQWVAEAIRATGTGNLQPSLHAFALLCGIGGASLLLSRRVC